MPESVYSLEIFKWIDREVVDHIIVTCSDRNYSEWEIIISQWEDSNWEWYILKNGKVSIEIGWSKIAELTPGNIFWEIALLNDEQRTATVKALTDIEVIVLTVDDLIEMINNDENKINKTIMHRIEENLNR